MELPTFKLISFSLCPYVQRARNILLEKNIPHEIEYIDLSQPPAWFYEISPLEKVPVLLVDGQSLFESLAICEYLDEITPGTLHPEPPFERAQNRAWIEYGNDILTATYRFFTTNDPDVVKQYEALLDERFDGLEDQLGSGPFFNGDVFCIIDMVYAPIFRFHNAVARYYPHDFFADTPKIRQWAQQLLARSSVQESVLPSYAEDLDQYLRKQESVFAQLMG